MLHVLDGPLAGERVRGRVDAERRRDHMQQHHGQHLLSQAFVRGGPGGDRRVPPGERGHDDRPRPLRGRATQARAAERLANDVVWEARPGARCDR